MRSDGERASVPVVPHGPANVIVVGSGAAGLAAALAARTAGATVTVFERAAHLGGTTAISGGVAWIPGNHLAAAAGIADSPADALRYLRSIGLGDYDDELARVFTEDAARVARLIEEHTLLRWALLTDWPDYHAEQSGGLAGGRSIWPRPLAIRDAIATRVQTTPEDPGPPVAVGTNDERVTDAIVFRGPVRGRVLVGALLTALDEMGADVHTDARVDRLLVEDGAVRGVVVEGVEHHGRVVLGTGGFQHDPALVHTFLPGTAIAPLGTPGCVGDALRWVGPLGAELGNMTEGWWMPAIHVPDETLDGAPFFRPLHHERAQPGAVMVDRFGRRFVDEAQNYGDVGRTMLRFDAGSFGYPAAPCWLVFDARYRSRYAIGPIGPAAPDPDWFHRADNLDELGAALGLPVGALPATMVRFNAQVGRAVDDDYGRGSHEYDRWIGDPEAPDPTLGALDTPPYYAVAVRPGCLGTKGGPRTDASGRVRTGAGSSGVIDGLYAAGNAAASPFGIGTAAGGATIGPALVFGTRAGEAAATDAATEGTS